MSYEPSPIPRFFLLGLLIAVAFVAGAVWQAAGAGASGESAVAAAQAMARERASPAQSRPRAIDTRRDLGEDEVATIEIFQRASPSVVYITSLAVRRDRFRMNLLEIPQGSGSGFVWDDSGLVVTNYHVIQRADRAEVTLADHSSWAAEVIGTAPEKDLAVLLIDAPPEVLHPIPVGTSADLLVGQKVLAIGNPFGLDQSLSTGIISALGREIESIAGVPIRDLIQTDAAINPGNSGGPLLDSDGRLIGVNTAIYSPSGAYAGIGFAIPVDTVNWVVPDLIAFGRVKRPTLGIELVNDAWVRRYGLQGALVLSVVPGGGADRAGLRGTERSRRGGILLGDLIVAIDGEEVTSANELTLLLEASAAGDSVDVEYVRDRERRKTTIVLGE